MLLHYFAKNKSLIILCGFMIALPPFLLVLGLVSPSPKVLRFVAATPTSPESAWCSEWGRPKKVGEIRQGSLNEASGLPTSIINPSLIYHINDNNDGEGKVFVTDTQGAFQHVAKIMNEKSEDYEALASGPCFEGRTCLFIGDIGNNQLKREVIKILVIEEELLHQSKVFPSLVLNLRFPEGEIKNAEAMTVHPITGDIFLTTKESSNQDRDIKRREVPAAQIFKLERQIWEETQFKREEKPLLLEKFEKIKMAELTEDLDSRKQLITGMDMAPDGKSFVLLTYQHAYEFLYDLSDPHLAIPSKKMKLNKDYRKLKLIRLPQQEGLTFFRGNEKLRPGILYHTEFKDENIGIPIIHIPCLNQF